MTIVDSDTQTATVSTEHTLETVTGPGTFVLLVNTNNMANGDELELRAYTKTLSGDSDPKLAFMATYIHDQGDNAAPGSSAYGDVVKQSPPIVVPHSGALTLKQTAGTGRNFPWCVVQVDA